jgi:hypothetical protein
MHWWGMTTLPSLNQSTIGPVAKDSTASATVAVPSEPAGGVLRPHRALHDPASTGSLSAMAASLSPAVRADLYDLLNALPSEVVVPGPRRLVPMMGSLRLQWRVNHLTAEALAAAMITRANIRVSVEAVLLSGVCTELGIPLELRSPTE